MCFACIVMLKKREQKACWHLWRRLPSWFGLKVEGWYQEKETVASDYPGVEGLEGEYVCIPEGGYLW